MSSYMENEEYMSMNDSKNWKKSIPLTSDLHITAHRIGDKYNDVFKITVFKFEYGNMVKQEIELSMFQFEHLRMYFSDRERQIEWLRESIEKQTNETRVYFAGKWHKAGERRGSKIDAE